MGKISIYNGSLRESNKKAGIRRKTTIGPGAAATGILHHYHTIAYNNINEVKCQVIFPYMKYNIQEPAQNVSLFINRLQDNDPFGDFFSLSNQQKSICFIRIIA